MHRLVFQSAEITRGVLYIAEKRAEMIFVFNSMLPA